MKLRNARVQNIHFIPKHSNLLVLFNIIKTFMYSFIFIPYGYIYALKFYPHSFASILHDLKIIYRNIHIMRISFILTNIQHIKIIG